MRARLVGLGLVLGVSGACWSFDDAEDAFCAKPGAFCFDAGSPVVDAGEDAGFDAGFDAGAPFVLREARSVGIAGAEDFVWAVSTPDSTVQRIGGEFQGTSYIGNRSLESAQLDAFVASLDLDAPVMATTHIQGGSNDHVAAISTIPRGDTWLTGSLIHALNGTAFDVGSSSAQVLNTVGVDAYDGYIARLDSDGRLVWARRMEAQAGAQVSPLGISHGPGADVVAVGTFGGDIAIPDGGSVQGLGEHGFAMALADDGTFKWFSTVTCAAGGDLARIAAVAHTHQGQVLVSGASIGKCEFQAADQSASSMGTTRWRGFVLRLEPDGTLFSAGYRPEQDAKGGTTWMTDVAATPTGGAVAVGEFIDSISLLRDGGFPMAAGASQDGFVVQLDSEDKVMWGVQLASDGEVLGPRVAVGESGIFVAGGVSGTLTVDGLVLPGVGTGVDGFLIQLNHQGAVLWGKRFGSGQDDAGVTDLDVDDQEIVTVVGNHTVGFGIEGAVLGGTDAGDSQGYVLRFEP